MFDTECTPARVSEYPKRDLTIGTLIIFFLSVHSTTFLSDGVDGRRGEGVRDRMFGSLINTSHTQERHAFRLFFSHSCCIVNRLQDKIKL